MIKIENTEVVGWDHAIRGMRNPMNSWDKSDTTFLLILPGYSKYGVVEAKIGENDLTLMKKLSKSGPVHSKFMRMIEVYADVTCHHAWWAEFDTYKVGTVRNSCSKMHKIHVKEFVAEDFSHEGIDEVGGQTSDLFDSILEELERLRNLFNSTQEKKYWRSIIELLPMGYNIRATIMLDYEVLKNVYTWRKNHKLDEWREFCKWIESLPYSELITGGDENVV